MATRVNISVKEVEQSTWRWAVAYAAHERFTMSALVMKALERYMSEVDPDGQFKGGG